MKFLYFFKTLSSNWAVRALDSGVNCLWIEFHHSASWQWVAQAMHAGACSLWFRHCNPWWRYRELVQQWANSRWHTPQLLKATEELNVTYNSIDDITTKGADRCCYPMEKRLHNKPYRMSWQVTRCNNIWPLGGKILSSCCFDILKYNYHVLLRPT